MESDAGKYHRYNKPDPELGDGATKPRINQFTRHTFAGMVRESASQSVQCPDSGMLLSAAAAWP